MGLTVMRSIKKAISIVPKLVPSLCSINKNCAVISYASGKNKSSLMQFVDNGVFALSLNEYGDITMIHEIDLDKDGNEVLGATPTEGMPLTRDNVLIQHMREKTAEGLPLRPGSPRQCEVGEVEDEDVKINDDEVEGKKRDAFGGLIAPKGYVYTGTLVFICFGPTLKHFAGTLAMGGQADRMVEEKKEGLRKVQRKAMTNHNNVDREVGFDRGLTMQSKIQCAMMVQNKDDTKQRHHDMCMMMITKHIESTERLVELKFKTSERKNLGGSEAQVFLLINLLMEKLERLKEDLDTMLYKKRTTNPIIGNVLAIAAKAMGLAKGDEDINESTADFISDIFK